MISIAAVLKLKMKFEIIFISPDMEGGCEYVE
jgi:hypothetical protein